MANTFGGGIPNNDNDLDNQVVQKKWWTTKQSLSNRQRKKWQSKSLLLVRLSKEKIRRNENRRNEKTAQNLIQLCVQLHPLLVLQGDHFPDQMKFPDLSSRTGKDLYSLTHSLLRVTGCGS